MNISGSLMDIYDYPKREAQIKKRCFTKFFDLQTTTYLLIQSHQTGRASYR